MPTQYYDVLVVGGGIHGAGVAQAAAASGYSVLVLEQSQVGAGTSSRSSKLIHGGLRYLETGQFSLVRESLHERELLLQNAPGLVKRVPFYIPVYKRAQYGRSKISIALSLYAVLGGLGREVRFRCIPRSNWPSLDGLETTDLCAVFQYWDAQTDDKALTQAVMRSAQDLGAEICMPATFEHAVREDELFRVGYRYKGRTLFCKTATLVNAAGPWVAQVLSRVQDYVSQIQTELVQGAHILLDGQINRGIYYLEAPSDKRPVFVASWKNRVMVGTTESNFTGNLSNVQPMADEVAYLIEVLSFYFPRFRGVQKEDVQSAFAGVRVLPTGSGSLGSRSRETLLEVDNLKQPRLLTIYGGKLTTYRSTAQKVINRLFGSLPDKTPRADTSRLVLKASPPFRP